MEHYIDNQGFKYFLLPKFHCKLNPFKRVWDQSKRYCFNFTLQTLRATIDPALDYVSVDLIRKVKDYEAAYMEGNKTGKDIENAVKKVQVTLKSF